MATLSVNKRRRRDLVDIINESIQYESLHRVRREVLTGPGGTTTDTTAIVNEMKTFFTNEGASDSTISWIE